MPRFVILQHDWPLLHWDLLLEAGPVLRAWRLLAIPALGTDIPTEPNADHRSAYLDYEGPVSGGRGAVLRWDFGHFKWLVECADRIEIELRGEKIAGRCVIWQPTSSTYLSRFE